MARIKTYNLDSGIDPADKVIGSDGKPGPTYGNTKNYSFSSLLSYFQGNEGEAGASAYQIWLDNGNTGTEQDFLASLIGAAGAQGPTGAAGSDGADGADGAQGIQGIQGTTGQTGATGAQGAQGLQGAQGAAGADGTSITVLGTVADCASLPTSGNTAGDLWIIDADDAGCSYGAGAQAGDGFVWTAGNTWLNIGPLRGPQGIQGIQGAQGLQGVAGSDGNDGEQGIQGETGPQGPQGPAGPQGPQGIQGIQGEQGIQGIQGLPGSDGSQLELDGCKVVICNSSGDTPGDYGNLQYDGNDVILYHFINSQGQIFVYFNLQLQVTGNQAAENFFNGNNPIYLKFIDPPIVIDSAASGYTLPAQVTYVGSPTDSQPISEYGVIKGGNLIELQADMLQIEALVRKGSEVFNTSYINANETASNAFKITMSGGTVGRKV